MTNSPFSAPQSKPRTYEDGFENGRKDMLDEIKTILTKTVDTLEMQLDDIGHDRFGGTVLGSRIEGVNKVFNKIKQIKE